MGRHLVRPVMWRTVGALLCALALTAASAFAQQTTGTINGRVLDEQGRRCLAHRLGHQREHRFHAQRRLRRRRRLPAHRPSGRHLRRGRPRSRDSPRSRRRGIVVNVAQTLDLDFDLKVAQVAENITVSGEYAAHRHQFLLGRRRRRHRPHREPAAQRPAVREPRRHDPRRRPRLPRRSDQEHAVLAADQRRQRPQRQLPDRRRRQQRRHRRRPAAAVPARSDPGVQFRDLALQGRVRPQQRRRA